MITAIGPRLRQEELLHGLDLSLRGLEIGPLDKPLLSRGGHNVVYADRNDAGSLRKAYAADASVKANNIPDIDVVLSETTLEEALGRNAVGYAVGSHVIEHVPDFVAFLKDVSAVLQVGGIFSLAVPDHRYTFDVFRRPTFFEDVQAAYENKNTRPSLDQVLDHAKNVVDLDLGLAWRDYERALRSARLKHPRANLAIFIEKHNAGQYLDAHCWIFTPHSFVDIVEKTCSEYNIRFSVHRLVHTKPMTNEFFVQLAKVHG